MTFSFALLTIYNDLPLGLGCVEFGGGGGGSGLPTIDIAEPLFLGSVLDRLMLPKCPSFGAKGGGAGPSKPENLKKIYFRF